MSKIIHRIETKWDWTPIICKALFVFMVCFAFAFTILALARVGLDWACGYGLVAAAFLTFIYATDFEDHPRKQKVYHEVIE